MQTIKLNVVKPNVFAESDVAKSEIWLKNVCFETGKFYLISAESGKGKTSLLDFIYCRRRDYSGAILFDDIDVKTLNANQIQNARSTQISHVFQGFRLFGELTARENINIKNDLTKQKSDAEIDEMFERLGISEKRNIPLSLLSFGQQQRVSIIRALCQPFNFLMIDEAFSHLDESNTAIACKLITEEVKRQNASLLVASLGEAYKFEYNHKFLL